LRLAKRRGNLPDYSASFVGAASSAVFC